MSLLLTIFEKLFCICTIHVTRIGLAYPVINGPFSYQRFASPILPGDAILSPCYDTIIYPHSLQLPLRPLAPSFDPSYPQALPLES